MVEGEDDTREREKGEERRHMMAHGQRLLEKRYPPPPQPKCYMEYMLEIELN